jgi:DNA-binding NarL/FixJ family response regulator
VNAIICQRTLTMTHSSKIRVLIAYEDPLISAGLAVTLQTQIDFEAVVSRPASQASTGTASDLPPADVVVADYDSGLRLLMSAGAHRHRIMILTPSDGEARIFNALERGARGYLLLGCSVQDLLEALRSVRAGGTALAPLVASRVAERMTYPALTPREAETLRQVMLGRSNKHIAIQLCTAVGTVKTHVKSILEKLNAASRTEAVAIARRRGILQEESERLPPAASARQIGSRLGSRESHDDSKWLRLGRRSGNSGAPIHEAPRNRGAALLHHAQLLTGGDGAGR